MTQRVRPALPMFNAHPFDGDGTSLYATVGTEVQYRQLRVLMRPRRFARRRRRGTLIKGTAGVHDIANSVPKTARIDSIDDPAEQFTTALPSALIPSSGTHEVTFDVRRHADHVECETSNSRVVTVTADNSGDGASAILGGATLLEEQVRAGGVVRVRFLWRPSVDGVQPDTFTLTRTAGPTSPSDVVQAHGGGTSPVTVEVDTAALSDASAYTFSVVAGDSVTGATASVLVGIVVAADAAGPGPATNGGAVAW